MGFACDVHGRPLGFCNKSKRVNTIEQKHLMAPGGDVALPGQEGAGGPENLQNVRNAKEEARPTR